MLNKVMLIGNLGADPETRFTQDGTCVCNLRLATTEKFKNKAGEQQEKTEWHRVILWGRLGEIANQYLSKGSKVYIEGKIETKKWQDRDGNDKYTTEIRVHEMKMLGSKQDQGQQQPAQGRQNQQSQQPYSRRQENGQNNFPSHGGNQQNNNQRSGSGDGKSNDPFASRPDFGDVPVDDDIPF